MSLIFVLWLEKELNRVLGKEKEVFVGFCCRKVEIDGKQTFQYFKNWINKILIGWVFGIGWKFLIIYCSTVNLLLILWYQILTTFYELFMFLTNIKFQNFINLFIAFLTLRLRIYLFSQEFQEFMEVNLSQFTVLVEKRTPGRFQATVPTVGSFVS